MSLSSKRYANLLYRRKNHEVGSSAKSPEFIIRLYPDEFKQWKRCPSEVPLSEVVDAWEIYVAKGGAHTGHLERPPHQLLQEIFGSTKFEDIFSFMAEHGHLDECPRHGDLEGHEKGAYLKK